MGFKKWYFLAFVVVFLTEITITILPVNPFIRGFLGDVLVVPLLYVFLKTFFLFPSQKTMLGVLAFAFLVELLQLFPIIEILSIESKTVRTVMGSTFDGWDFVAYFIGYLIVLLVFSFGKRLREKSVPDFKMNKSM